MSKTGIVYHEDMMKHECEWDTTHPECPGRFQSCLDLLKESNTLKKCHVLPSREATNEEILKVHSQSHLQLLENTQDGVDNLEEFSSHYDSVYFNAHTSRAAKLAAGCSVTLVEAVIQEKIKNGIALVRPPGHHATHNEFGGYSFLNNIAIAAKVALESYGLTRILIVDWDIHHGQGTQRAFYEDPRVVYFSIHRYENAKFWPHLRESNYDYIGKGEGTGFNINIPLNSVGCGDMDYIHIFEEILEPIAKQYIPELIIVSAGFDSALGDPKGQMQVTPQCFALLCQKLMKISENKLALILEGGYCIKALSHCVLASINTLLNFPLPPLPEQKQNVSQTLKDVSKRIKVLLKDNWKFDVSPLKSPTEIEEIELNFAKHCQDGPPFPTRDDYWPPVSETTMKMLEEVTEKLRQYYKLCNSYTNE